MCIHYTEDVGGERGMEPVLFILPDWPLLRWGSEGEGGGEGNGSVVVILPDWPLLRWGSEGEGVGEGNGPVVVILPVCPLLMGSRAALLTELKHKTPPCPPLDRVKTKSLISNFILRLYAILHASPLAVHSRFHAVIKITKV